MPTIEITVRRSSAISSRPFEGMVARLTATIGQPDMLAFHNAIVEAAIESSQLKERSTRVPQTLRLVVGDPAYDSMVSLVAPYGNEAALAVARNLDTKITNLIEMTANWRSLNDPSCAPAVRGSARPAL